MRAAVPRVLCLSRWTGLKLAGVRPFSLSGKAHKEDARTMIGCNPDQTGHLTSECRSHPRLALAMPARCRMLSGFTEDVVIRDLSAGGCRIASHVLNLRPGDLVVLRPAGMEGLAGRVCWCDRREAGLAFERPLYAPVVEHLHRSYATFRSPVVPFRAGPAQRLAA